MSLSAYYQLKLLLQGPILSQASGGRSFDLDTAMLRYHGKPVLNGSQVRGVLRHALEHFAEQLKDQDPYFEQGQQLSQQIKGWFGNQSEESSQQSAFEPRAASVGFDFFWLCENEPTGQSKQRHRIQIGATGKVEEGSLRVIEDCFGSGSEVAFTGGVRIQASDQDELDSFQNWLQKAIAYIPAIGALKGSGFGKLLGGELLQAKDPLAVDELPIGAASPVTMCFALEFDRPWCIGGSRPSGADVNRIMSQKQVPGSALKAVVARQLKAMNQWDEINAYFDDIRFTHAKPSLAGRMPALPLPLSLVSFGAEQHDIVDVAHRVHPCYRRKANGEVSTLAFQADWKINDWNNAKARFYGGDVAYPQTWISVRTAINPQTNTADDGKLFTLECVDPVMDNGEIMPWIFGVDLSCIQEAARRETVANILRNCFANGLNGIGKTKACAKVNHLINEVKVGELVEPDLTPEGEFTVLLCSAARLLPYPDGVKGCNGHNQLFELYAQYWDKVSKGTLQLQRYFAEQELMGSRYLHGRYFVEATKQYQPNWLTKAGSVFVLKPRDGQLIKEAQVLMQQWTQRGVPAAPYHGDYSQIPTAKDWQTEPYLPENGYGEIVVNHNQQIKLAAYGEEYVDVEL